MGAYGSATWVVACSLAFFERLCFDCLQRCVVYIHAEQLARILQHRLYPLKGLDRWAQVVDTYPCGCTSASREHASPKTIVLMMLAAGAHTNFLAPV